MTNELIQKIAAGALAGLLGAIKTDLDAWTKNPGTRFDWSLALRRWIEGAATVCAVCGKPIPKGLEGMVTNYHGADVHYDCIPDGATILSEDRGECE